MLVRVTIEVASQPHSLGQTVARTEVSESVPHVDPPYGHPDYGRAVEKPVESIARLTHKLADEAVAKTVDQLVEYGKQDAAQVRQTNAVKDAEKQSREGVAPTF